MEKLNSLSGCSQDCPGPRPLYLAFSFHVFCHQMSQNLVLGGLWAGWS
jgi:hypothetical protein